MIRDCEAIRRAASEEYSSAIRAAQADYRQAHHALDLFWNANSLGYRALRSQAEVISIAASKAADDAYVTSMQMTRGWSMHQPIDEWNKSE